MEIKIKPVETKKELLEFIKFPFSVYKENKLWVPPIISDMQGLLSPEKNPFWEHAEMKLFVLEKDGKIAGRIAAIIDRNFIQFHEEMTGFFGFYESINDTDVADRLLFTVKSWLKSKGMKKIIGPTAPSTNDEMGFLYEGYDTPPYLMMPHTHRYYIGLMESIKMKKAKDLYAYLVNSADLPHDRLERINEIVYKRNPGLVVRKINLKNLENDVKIAHTVYNLAWEKNWGFVPWTEKEFYEQYRKLKDLLLPDTTLLATINDNPVGMLIGVPNYNELLKDFNGKMGPVQLVQFLLKRNKIKTMRIMIMGVVKEYRNKGIEGVLYHQIIKNGMAKGYNVGEFSWILEDNTMMCRAAEMLGGKLYKKYRVFETEIL